jgi:Mg-chelatase subunit ChlD
MGIFKKKDADRDSGESKNLPTDIFLNPGLKVLEGFKSDKDIPEPIIRLTKCMRERFGVKAGDTVVVKKDDKLVKAKVEVSSASDGEEQICRLNRAAREILKVHVGGEIEIIPPETLLLLIDTSGSMGDFVTGIMKMDATRNAVREFIRSKFLLSEGDKIGIVSFGQFATVVERPTMNYEHLENRSSVLMPNGATAMHEGMSLAIDVLSFSEGAKRIVMLTDGVPTTTGKMAIIALAKTAAAKHIVIDTVGVGSPFDLMGYDELLLKRIAAITGGTFRRVLDIQELTGQFRELAAGKNYTYLLPEK